MPVKNSKTGQLHIVTVGTSLLQNCGWHPGESLPSESTLLTKLRSDPRKVSAELNALIPFLDQDHRIAVHLIATDTHVGRLACKVIGDFLKALPRIEVQKVEIKDLLPDMDHSFNRTKFEVAVMRFRERIFSVAEKARNRGMDVFINATGGLKCEVAVATLVAAELSISAYYIHQSMGEPVFLPTAAVDANSLSILKAIEARKFTRKKNQPEHDLLRLQREGLVTIQRDAFGEISSAKLTRYAKHLIRK